LDGVRQALVTSAVIEKFGELLSSDILADLPGSVNGKVPDTRSWEECMAAMTERAPGGAKRS
jgi:hypothetical protein